MASEAVEVFQGALSRREQKDDGSVWKDYHASLYDDGRLVLRADGQEHVVELTKDDVISESRLKTAAFQIANGARTVVFSVDTFKHKMAWLNPLSAVISDLSKPRRHRTAAQLAQGSQPAAAATTESEIKAAAAAAPAPAPTAPPAAVSRTMSNSQLNGGRRRADFAHPDAPAPVVEPSNNPFDLKRTREAVNRHRRTASVESDTSSVAQTENSQEFDVKSVNSDNMSVLGVGSSKSGSTRHLRQDSSGSTSISVSGMTTAETASVTTTASSTQGENPIRARMARRTPSNRELLVAPESGENPFDLKAVARPPTAGRSRRGEDGRLQSGAGLQTQSLAPGTRAIMDTTLPSLSSTPPLRRSHSFQPRGSPSLFEPSSPLVQPPSPTRAELAATAQSQDPPSPAAHDADAQAGAPLSARLSSTTTTSSAVPAYGRAAASPLRRAQSVRLRPSFADRMQTAMAGAPSLRQEATASATTTAATTATAAGTSTPPVKRTQSLQLSPSLNENESTPIIRPMPTGAAPSATNDDSPVRPTLLTMGGRASSMRYGKHDLASAFSAELTAISEETNDAENSSTRKTRVWDSLASRLGRSNR